MNCIPLSKYGWSNLAHTRIVRNILTALTNQLQGTNCEAVCNDLLVHTPQGLDAYPDVVVFCGEPEFSDVQQRVLSNPRVIIEVLSPSTELRDRASSLINTVPFPAL